MAEEQKDMNIEQESSKYQNAENELIEGINISAGKEVIPNKKTNSSEEQREENTSPSNENKGPSVNKRSKGKLEKIRDFFPKTTDKEWQEWSMYDNFIKKFMDLAKGAKSPDDLLLEGLLMAMCLPLDKIKAFCDFKTRKRREGFNGEKAKKDWIKLKEMEEGGYYNIDPELKKKVYKKWIHSMGYEIRNDNDPVQNSVMDKVNDIEKSDNSDENKREQIKYYIETFVKKEADKQEKEMFNKSLGKEDAEKMLKMFKEAGLEGLDKFKVDDKTTPMDIVSNVLKSVKEGDEAKITKVLKSKKFIDNLMKNGPEIVKNEKRTEILTAEKIKQESKDINKGLNKAKKAHDTQTKNNYHQKGRDGGR